MSELIVIIGILLYVYLLVTTIYLLLDNRESSSTLAWILVFIFLPLAGFIVYIMAGRNWRKKKKNEQLRHGLIEKPLQRILNPLNKQHQEIVKKNKKKWKHPKYKNELIQLLYHSSDSLITAPNQVKLFFCGKEKFRHLIRDLAGARNYIFIECFIWRSDELTSRIKEILIAKAGQGVEIKLLTDSFGSLFLRKKYINDLRQAGIKIYKYYNFLSLFKFHTINYRNHRKIIVIDGEIGYTGGMNMAQEYIDGGKRFHTWRDTHLRIAGQAVTILKTAFAIDWFNTTHEDILKSNINYKKPAIKKNIPIQITTSGPDSKWPSIKQLFFCLINSAQENIYIQTPYFIPDPSVYTALKTSGLRGLDVRLLVTGVPDKKLPYWSAYTYFEELLRAGVKIYHYQKGFMHSKTIAIDSEICSVGTANMDMRSFTLNYELNTLIYDRQLTGQLERQFRVDLKNSRRLTEERYQKIGTVKRLGHSIARLVAPLL